MAPIPITRKRRALLIPEAPPPTTESATEPPQTSIEDAAEDVDPQPLIHRSRKRLRLGEKLDILDPSVRSATLEEFPLEPNVEDSLDTNSPTVLSPNSPTISTSRLNFETAPTEVMTSFDNVFPASTEITSPSLVPVTPVYRSDNTATIADLFSIPALPSSIRLSFFSRTGISTIFVDPSILGSSHSGGLPLQSLSGPSRLPASSVHIEEINPIPDTRVVPNPDPASATLAISSEFEAFTLIFCVIPTSVHGDFGLACKRIKVKAPEVVTPVALPAKRKERSLSSLVVSTPRVSSQSGMTGRRSKSIARKASKGSSFTIEKPVTIEDDSPEEYPESSSSPEMLRKYTQNARQKSAAREPSNRPSPDKGRENANRSKSSKLSAQGSVEELHSYENEGLLSKTKNKENRQKSKLKDEKNCSDHAPSESERPKKLRKIRAKKAQQFGEVRVSPQDVLDATDAKFDKEIIQFGEEMHALASDSCKYLRIKDGSIPVSFIQKYLKRKLDLTSEDEVEIKCMGHRVIPTLTLSNLIDLWLETTSTERVSTTIGSSAKDFVMVLGYARRVLDS
ncbi:hypothetical protein BUALT_Bualt13G0016700 [Buddleja alternifolia]|uniref:Uncharacterized protein n=1 Tax=Buddleja alternifolia TaxID=168488 RepID=A0AAV6WT38_9LAMI|nr:hypothetical protein BUALT_Bualt13G0016700 [Buddleja alternifolia]